MRLADLFKATYIAVEEYIASQLVNNLDFVLANLHYDMDIFTKYPIFCHIMHVPVVEHKNVCCVNIPIYL